MAIFSAVPRSGLEARGWNAHRNNVRMVPSESMGTRIVRLRLASGRTQRQLAKDAGVSASSVFEAECDHTIRLTSFVKIARALRVSLDYLWSGSGRMG